MIFRGAKIEIGPIDRQDQSLLFGWVNDVEAARFDLAFRPMHWQAFSHWMTVAGNDPANVHFAIRGAATGSTLGYMFLKGVNTVHRSAEVGIRIGREVDRGKGFGREAMQLALLYAWQVLNLRRVWLMTMAANERALRSFSAAGFQQEAVLRKALYLSGRWNDEVIMSVLRPL